MPLNDDSDTDELLLKLRPKGRQQEVLQKKQLDERVKSIEENKSVYKEQITTLCSNFAKILTDKTLPENASLLKKNVEKEVKEKLIELSVKLNNDESESEGMGATMINALLLNCLLLQRDKINSLEHRLSLIETKK